MFKVGQAIEAKWIDKHYYPGTILSAEGNGMRFQTQGNIFFLHIYYYSSRFNVDILFSGSMLSTLGIISNTRTVITLNRFNPGAFPFATDSWPAHNYTQYSLTLSIYSITQITTTVHQKLLY